MIDQQEGSERCNVTGFEDEEREPGAEECGQPLQNGKGKKPTSLPKLPLERPLPSPLF